MIAYPKTIHYVQIKIIIISGGFIKTLKGFILISLIFSAFLLITACDESSTGGDDSNLAEANQLAQAGFDLLNVKAQELENKDMDNVDEG